MIVSHDNDLHDMFSPQNDVELYDSDTHIKLNESQPPKTSTLDFPGSDEPRYETDVKLEHPQNAKPLISVTFDGIEIVFKLMHSEKAPAPIDVTVDEIMTDVRLEHS